MAQISVLFGKNNSGKSSLLKLPYLVHESLRSPKLLTLRSRDHTFASNFRTLANVGSAHPSLKYGVTLSDDNAVDVTLQVISSLLDEEEVVTDFRSTHHRWSRTLQESAEFPKNLDKVTQRTAEAIAAEIGDVQLLSSASRSIEARYSIIEPDWGLPADVPAMLWKERLLRDKVSEWLRKNLGVDVGVDSSRFGFSLTAHAAGRDSINLCETGRGTQSVVHVVTLLFAAQMGLSQCGLIILEEPESHLHPAAHASLAEVIVQSSKSCQILVETHSETFILRLRRMIAEGRLARGDLALTFVDEDQVLTPVVVDESGGVDSWPPGIFEEDVQEARKLVEARLRALGDT